MSAAQMFIQVPLNERSNLYSTFPSSPRQNLHSMYSSPQSSPSPRFQRPFGYAGIQRTRSQITLSPTSSPKGRSIRSGYSMVSQADAKRLIVTLLASSSGFEEKRKEYIAQQRSSRAGGKADVVNMVECLEVAGEKSRTFEQLVRKLGIFDEEKGGDTFVLYKKVPRTALQQKTKQPDREEDVLTYLFSRWMHVDSDSVKLILQKSLDRTFKVWRSVIYINQHGIYCEMFVISSEFNRHLFHREILA